MGDNDIPTVETQANSKHGGKHKGRGQQRRRRRQGYRAPTTTTRDGKSIDKTTMTIWKAVAIDDRMRERDSQSVKNGRDNEKEEDVPRQRRRPTTKASHGSLGGTFLMCEGRACTRHHCGQR